MDKTYRAIFEETHRMAARGDVGGYHELGPFAIAFYEKTKDDKDFTFLWDSDAEEVGMMVSEAFEEAAERYLLKMTVYNDKAGKKLEKTDVFGKPMSAEEARSKFLSIAGSVEFPWGEYMEKMRESIMKMRKRGKSG